MMRELEKLALYLDAAPDRPREVDHAAMDAIGADLGEVEMGDAVEAVVEGRVGDLGGELALLDEGGASPFPGCVRWPGGWSRWPRCAPISMRASRSRR